MATKGYSNYRGRSPFWKRILVIVLVVLLLGAAVFLYCQNHLVYDENGQVHLELPFMKDREEKPADDEGVKEVELEREEPQKPIIETLHARQLADDALEEDITQLLSGADEAVVVQVKLPDGIFTYQPTFAVESGSVAATPLSTENLKKLIASDKHVIARISALCDTTYANAHVDDAGLLRTWDQWLWYDYDGRCWLDLSKPDTQTYLRQVCKDLADLGFREILLDDFGWPAYGNLEAVLVEPETDKVTVITDFLHTLRETLPKITALSVVVRYDNPYYSGLTPEVLGSFDRVYVDAYRVDVEAFAAAMPQGFVRDTQLVLITDTAPAAGSYLLES